MKHREILIILSLLILLSGSALPAFAIDIKKDNIDAIGFYNNAVDNASAGRFEEAVNLTGQALSIQPNFTLALITRTGALLELGRIKEAKASLDAARSLDPEGSAVLATAASYSLQVGEYRNANQYADKALAGDPTLLEAWVIKGTAYGNLGEFQEEADASKQALLLDPSNQKALSNLQYATEMKKQGKKTPLGVGSVLLALIGTTVLLMLRKE